MEPTGKGKRGRVDKRVAQEEAARAWKHELHVTSGKGDRAVGRDGH